MAEVTFKTYIMITTEQQLYDYWSNSDLSLNVIIDQIIGYELYSALPGYASKGKAAEFEKNWGPKKSSYEIY